MNKQRRDSLAEAQKRLNALMTPDVQKAVVVLTKLRDEAEQIKADVQSITEEEQETYDNMPESLQSGERGQASCDALDKLSEADSALDELEDKIQEIHDTIEGLQELIDQADASLSDAQS